MKHFLQFSSAVLAAGLFATGCGDNLTPAGSSSLLPPKDTKALSLGSASVLLSWSSPGGTSDSAVKAYVVRLSAKEDSVGSATLSFQLDSLAPGVTVFSLFSRGSPDIRVG